MRRRLAFATPFVLVVGCKAPAPAHPEEAEEAPVVVAIPEPIDAAVAEVAVIDAPVDAPMDAGLGPGTTWNPPRPPPPNRMPTGNPPGPMRVRILDISIDGDKTIITIGAGTAKGIDPKRYDVRVIAADGGKPVRGGEVTLIRCTERTCVGKVKLGPDELRMNPEVEVRWR